MDTAFWESVAATGRAVPRGRPLDELTTELTRMLGSSDPYVRIHLAVNTLLGWIDAGVYDDLLTGLGDGMAAGLGRGLGEDRTSSVFRRSTSAAVLTRCLSHDNQHRLVSESSVRRWGDAVVGWIVRERDLRAYVPDQGWARAVAHGADALAALAGSPSMGMLEVTVILDVIADRVTADTDYRFLHGEDDRLAMATVAVLRRDLLTMSVLDPWVARLTESARRVNLGVDDYRVTGNVQSFLRSLYLALSLAPSDVPGRGDLMLTLLEALRATNPEFRPPPEPGAVPCSP